MTQQLADIGVDDPVADISEQALAAIVQQVGWAAFNPILCTEMVIVGELRDRLAGL